jgi:hypothetical protein
MHDKFSEQRSPVILLGALLTTVGNNIPATAFPVAPPPLYQQSNTYQTTISTNGDLVDIYFPVTENSSNHRRKFPIALFLQGALVDKSDYSNYALQVSRYGFVVVVPNHIRTVTIPTGPVKGFFPEQQQVLDVLAFMKKESLNTSSRIFGQVDTSRLVLLGHSFGGSAGLGATQQEICAPETCSSGYVRPPELKAGIFFGTSFRDQQTNEPFPINNHGVVIGMIRGDLDGVAAPINSQKTYDQIRNSPKTLITLKGANHYGITNADNPAREPNRPTLDQTTAVETIARWSALFLRANVLRDPKAISYVYGIGDSLDKNVTVQQAISPGSISIFQSWQPSLKFRIPSQHQRKVREQANVTQMKFQQDYNY